MYQRIRHSILITTCLLAIGLAANPAQADSPVVGAMLGGGAGAWVGNSVGGRDGAIVGGALGAVAGVVIASDYRRAPVRYAPQPVYYYTQPTFIYSAPIYSSRYEMDRRDDGWKHGRDHSRHGYRDGDHDSHHDNRGWSDHSRHYR